MTGINWYERPRSKRPRIETMIDGGGFDAGDRYSVELETDGEIYFTDGCDRYVYLYKKDEGKDFVYVRRGEV